MNRILLLLAVMISLCSKSQPIIQYDYMETFSTGYATAGWWTPALTAGWFTNASVTPTQSAVLYGSGSGTSAAEQDWYSLPNITGLDAAKQYQLKFRLASYTFSAATATTRGVDVADIVDIQTSINGGATFVSQLRITGNTNAQWTYASTGNIFHTANGTFTNSAAPAGDVYQAPAGITTTAPSTIMLNLQTGITQIAIDIFCRSNSSGEEWWIDNIELLDVTPTPLPVELTYFNGINVDGVNVLKWQTASEHNSSHFVLHRSQSGDFANADMITLTPAAGNSTVLIDYVETDKTYESGINYYLLVQHDVDGHYTEYGPVAIDNSTKQRKVVKVINLRGQEVSYDQFTSTGIYIEVYDDGTMKRVWK